MGLLKMFGLSTEKEAQEREEQAWSEGRSTGYSSGHSAGKADILKEQQTSLSNIAKGSQVKFAVPYFDVFDPRFQNYAVPVSVHGMIVYAVDDINKFNSINKTQNINDGVFQQKMKGQLTKFIKGVITNAPYDNNIQVMQLERKILELSELIQRLVTPKIEQLFGVNVRSIDITEIVVDKDSRGYRELKSVTQEFEQQNLTAQHQANLSNFNLQNSLNQDLLKTQSSLNLDAMKRQQELQLGGQEELQAMQLENQRETMRIQREEMQRAARLQTETNFLGAHQANLNADVANTKSMFAPQQQASQAPQMPQMPGMPPIPGMGGMPPMPGAVPQVQYMVNVNNQAMGPYDWNQLQQLVQQSQLTQQSFVWKQGMPQWDAAGNIEELQPLFAL